MPLLVKLSTYTLPSVEDIFIYERLFHKVLHSYRGCWIQAKPSSGNWTCRPQGCGRCIDCRKLDEFLRSPTQTTEYFAVDKRRRQHLHERLEFTTHSHETSRSWKPVQGIDKDTLVVKKAKSASTHELLKRWETQAKEGETLLATMNQDVLKKLLGEKYAELTDLRAGPGNIGTNHQNKVPQKRKAEVIDLT